VFDGLAHPRNGDVVPLTACVEADITGTVKELRAIK
jgi:hypothetical protein